jgi:hypothetical protein
MEILDKFRERSTGQPGLWWEHTWPRTTLDE